jgi:paraquat-inducible protein A
MAERMQAASASIYGCRGCGLFQSVPAMAPGEVARCSRCGTSLRHTVAHSIEKALALNLTSLCLFAIAATMTLLTVSKAGMVHAADLLAGPAGLESHGLGELALVVLITTMVAPLLKMLASIYVLAGLGFGTPHASLRHVFVWVERLRPWSMIEVYLLGVFVAFVKLSDLVHLEMGPAMWALGALTFTMIAADSVLDSHEVWERLDPRRDAEPQPAPAAPPPHAATEPTVMVLCHACRLVTLMPRDGHATCPRCGSTLHARETDSVARTWALTLAALILYVPANLYPVLTVVQLGAGSPSTIFGGVIELFAEGMYPLAALVFFASVAVPVLKLVGLMGLLICIQTRRTGRLRDRTRLYWIVNFVGRWSMIDIFMESLLGALVQFGSAVTIDPGFGAVAFAGVVIITMFAAEGFDPRLMWDAAESRLKENAT